MARAILARPVALLECQNVSSHSGTVSCNTLFSARMARAILAWPVAEWLGQGQLQYFAY